MGFRMFFNRSQIEEKVAESSWVLSEAMQSQNAPTVVLVLLVVTGLTYVFLRQSRRRVIGTSETFKRIQTNVLHTPLDKVRARWELDTPKVLDKSTFSMKPAALIARTREVLDKAFNQGAEDGYIALAEEDMEMESFRAVLYPGSASSEMDGKAYLNLVKKARMRDAFPNFCPNVWSMNVDPMNPRVWLLCYPRATHNGKWTPLFGEPTSKQVVLPPSMFSLTFNESGKVVYFSGGFPMDYTGSTGGLSGLFGILYATRGSQGFIPETRPYTKSIGRRLFEALSMS